jgi:acetate kinase
MNIVVLNCGSSSVKIDVFDDETANRLRTANVERIGKAECFATLKIPGQSEKVPLAGADHARAIKAVLPDLLRDITVQAVGHRVVHGGQRFVAPTRIDPPVIEALRSLIPLAPIHNPANIAGIEVALELLPEAVHVAVFDTAFHATLPKRAFHYALPRQLVEQHGIRRYGFHGPSHRWVAGQAAAYLDADIRELRLITCHLGNGASVCAVENGRSVETSMGMTPLEGLVMGTRTGDVDAGVLINLMRSEQLTIDEVDRLLNKASGLAGLTGTRDMRDIEERANNGDVDARLAIGVFAHRVRKYIGAYAAVMGGLDAIVFTAGIGENSALIRHRVAQRLGFLGARIDEDANRDVKLDEANPVADISEANSRVRLLVVRTDEARAIAREAAHLAHQRDLVQREPSIPVAVSARHIHLTDDAVEVLFGKGHTLTPSKPLSQPGQFACEEELTVVGTKRSIKGVRVLGPTRSKCQVEISRTDEFYLGVDAPVRNSGDVENSPGVTLIGPAGQLTLSEGLICARRHIHMAPADAAAFGVKNGDVVSVALDTEGRDLVFGDVLIRVSPQYKLEMHIDTDEANAAELAPDAEGELVDTGKVVHLVERNTQYESVE